MTSHSRKFETSDYIVAVVEEDGERVYSVAHKGDGVVALILRQLPAAIAAARALQEDLDRVLDIVVGDEPVARSN
jgi:hypothetical protein